VGILGRVSRGRLIAIVAAGGLAAAGCGSQSAAVGGSGASRGARATHTVVPARSRVAHPQTVEPVAGAAATVSAGAGAGAAGASGASVSSDPSSSGGTVGGHASETALAHPASLATIRAELTRSGMSASTTQATLTSNGLAIAPIGAPAAVQEIIAAGNQIAHLPYIWGGGHLTYEDSGYDCSGSISFVLASAGLLNGTMTSGQLMHWGKPGPGKWITVYATDGHTFMEVAGLRFDTVALAETGSRWSNRPPNEPNLSSFVARHPAGL
jgi:cell wall-associated NlpC family hydrolase